MAHVNSAIGKLHCIMYYRKDTAYKNSKTIEIFLNVYHELSTITDKKHIV